MDSFLCSFAADTDFGPSVLSCRREFDFTLLFEEAVLVTLPAGIFIILAIASLVSRRHSPTLFRHGRLYSLKIFAATHWQVCRSPPLGAGATRQQDSCLNSQRCCCAYCKHIHPPVVSCRALEVPSALCASDLVPLFDRSFRGHTDTNIVAQR